MLKLLKGLDGPILVNGIEFESVVTALHAFEGKGEHIVVKLNESVKIANKPPLNTNNTTMYEISVKPYMTKPATPSFDFQDKWNNGNPMPLRIMVGEKIKETKGMVYMKLQGKITQEISTHCVRCGRQLTNTISKYLGIGPECGGHEYSNPTDTTEDELRKAIQKTRQQLSEIKWEGWIVKSAILTERIVEEK